MSVSILATGVGKRYRTVWALRDCNLSLPAGRIVALVGPNGAGKTTLMHLAVGLLRPSAGEVTVFGWEIVPYLVDFEGGSSDLRCRFVVVKVLTKAHGGNRHEPPGTGCATCADAGDLLR